LPADKEPRVGGEGLQEMVNPKTQPRETSKKKKRHFGGKGKKRGKGHWEEKGSPAAKNVLRNTSHRGNQVVNGSQEKTYKGSQRREQVTKKVVRGIRQEKSQKGSEKKEKGSLGKFQQQRESHSVIRKVEERGH